jgi:hypothetical protein
MAANIKPQDLSRLAKDLKPYIVAELSGGIGRPQPQAAPGGGGELTPHNIYDTSIHLGEITVSQATWALQTAIFNTHAADPAAHHAPVTEGAGINVLGQQVSVDPVDFTDTARGLSVAASKIGVSLSAASGLQFAGGALAIQPKGNSGLTIDSTGIALGNPGDLGSGPIVFGLATVGGVSHWHRLLASADPGVSSKPLASDAAGKLKLSLFEATTSITAPLFLSTGQGIELRPDTEIFLNPTGNAVKLMDGTRIQSDGYASETTGWGISFDGRADFRWIFANELHAQKFIADLEMALAGMQIIAKSVAVLGADYLIPALGASSVFTVKDLPSSANQPAFNAGDVICFRVFTRVAGGITIGDAYGTVTAYTDQSGPSEGFQNWTFNRFSGLAGGSLPGNTTWAKKDDPVIDYGVSGGGYHEINATQISQTENGVTATSYGPYSQVVTWSGTSPAMGRKVRTRSGNLKGIFQSGSDDYGFFAGSGAGVTDQYVKVSQQGVELHNIPIMLYSGTKQTVNISADGQTVWIGPSATDRRINWDGTTLTVKGVMTIQAAGSNVPWTAITGTGKPADNATVGATWGSNLGGIPGRFGDTAPAGAPGLYMTPSYMGYWNGAAWGAYIRSNGYFGFSGNSNNYITWDGSTLAIRGSVTIDSGSVPWGAVTGTSKPADNATVGATWGSNLGAIPARFGNAPAANVAGLHLTASYMGYWNGTAWKTYMNSSGYFRFAGSTATSYIEWDPVSNWLQGVYNGNTQWMADTTDGKFKCGTVDGAGVFQRVTLDASGVNIPTVHSYSPVAGPTTYALNFSSPASAPSHIVAKVYHSYNNLLLTASRLFLEAWGYDAAGADVIAATRDRLGNSTGETYLGMGRVQSGRFLTLENDGDSNFHRAKIGYLGYADYAGFGHRGAYETLGSTAYALLQNRNGSTYLNAATGATIYLRIGNSGVGYIQSWGMNMAFVNLDAGWRVNAAVPVEPPAPTDGMVRFFVILEGGYYRLKAKWANGRVKEISNNI